MTSPQQHQASADGVARGTILVVDDEESVGRLLQQWLTDEGYHVQYGADFEAVRSCMEAEEFDLVTLDIMMPGVDGIQVLRWLRQNHPDTGVLMATALGNLDTVLEAMRLGAINYLLKPFNLDLVTQEIERGMERQRLVAENRAYQQGLERQVAERTRELQQRVRELEARDRLVQIQMAPPDSVRAACSEIVSAVAPALCASSVTMYLPDQGAGRLRATATWRAGRAPATGEEDETDGDVSVAAGRSVAAQALVHRAPQSDGGGALATPVLHGASVLGVLAVTGVPNEEREQALEVLSRLAAEAALVLRMVELTAALASADVEVQELLEDDDGEQAGDMAAANP